MKMIRIENNRINTGDLLRSFLMLRDGETLEKITPSRYITEMQMSVEQRLRSLNDRSRTQRIGQQNKLYTLPDLIVFQNFQTLVKYSTNFSFIHQKQHAVRIKVSSDLSPCFTLNELPGIVYTKLAPGTPHKLTLNFCAEEHRDYLSFIRIEAEDDIVTLPIVALAPRPLLIFPDTIEITGTVVNIQSDKRVFMRNCGDAPIDFKFKTEFPFSICPKIGILGANSVVDVMVSYKNCRVQSNTSDLIMSFDGIQLCTILTCEAKNCDIYLDKTVLYFEDTFLSLKQCLHVNLINNSEYTMKYQWKEYETKYAEMEKCERYRLKLEDMNEYDVLRNIQDENPNITDAELHKIFIQRIYQDELAEFDSTDQFLFHDQNFRFQESSGLIGPHTTITIEVFFNPLAADSYVKWAYFDVTGRETRQPLKLVGSGIGPVVTLHVKDLDVEDLYLCAKHQYEIVAQNGAIIPATLSYCHKSLDFGGSMTCTPPDIYIEPGMCEKLVLEFSSTVQGKFLEDIKFKIEESQETIDLIFRGNIICPLLTYNVEEINFGVVAFGFAVEREISMKNSTEVPIEFKISILDDGDDEAITWVNFSMNHDEHLVSSNPKEFNIHPDEATVAGNSSITIKITLIPNKVRQSSTFLHTYMWGSKKHYVEIPVFYNCVVPQIECIPPKLDIRYCFIDCPYDRMFTLKNVSEVAGYLLYREQDTGMGLTCNLSLTESYIEPGETISIHLEIKGFELGLHTKNLVFTVFGQSPITLCKLSCDVQGPVICVNPEEIKFGFVELLRWQSRTLHVMNDSPVSAEISITVANPIFQVSPNEFVLEASEKMDVEVSIYLTYCSKYSSIIVLNIVNNSDPLRVPVTAVGIGSCILFEPELEPEFNLGTLMTHNNFMVPFKMTNMGRETQRLCFSLINNIKNMKADPALKGYPFNVEPNFFEINEKDTKTGYVEVYNSTPGPAELMYYCYSIDKGAKINKIFDVKMVAYFEDPILSLSRSSLHFRMDVTPTKTTAYLKETFVVTNDTFLALDIYISLEPPFFVHDANGTLLSILNTNVPSKGNFSFFVEFVPPTTEKRCNTSAGMMIIGFTFHPRMFNVPLIGEVNYPTVITYPDSIENEQIPPMANSSWEFILKNVSPLTAPFKFEWAVDSYVIEKLSSPTRGVSLRHSTIWKLDFPHKKGEISICALSPDGPRHCLENVFSEGSDNVPTSLFAFRKVVLQHKRLPEIHDDTMRTMLRVCNLVLGSVLQISKSDNDFIKPLTELCSQDESINESVLNITPHHGFLEPYECILVNFFIRPPPQISLKAAVKCQIFGGAEETIEISGVCGDIAFDIDRKEINFGNQLFCDVLQSTITLTNTGGITLDFLIVDDYEGIPTKQEMSSSWMNVTPNTGTLVPGQSVKLLVKFFPGTTGEFKEFFTIEVGYLRAIMIEVHGFGLYSQLCVLLPRPNLIDDCDSYFCYNAIGSLASDLFDLHPNTKLLKAFSLDETTKSILEFEGWVVIENMDEGTPSLVDIDMAIERKIGHDFLQNNPYIFSQVKTIRKKHFSIPNFKVPSYTVSFGNVRLDVQYQKDISLCNYGPGICNMRLMFVDKKLFESYGLVAVLDTTRLKVNEFGVLSITFQPNAKAASMQQPIFSQNLFIEVCQGAKIPIDVTASIGVPVMELNTKCLDFYGVIVGNCKRKTMRLQNTGFVEVNWSCSIDSSLFFVKKSEGLLHSGDSEKLYIFFEPKHKGPRQAVITYSIEGNDEEYTATLNGYGLEPKIVINDSLMQFKPSLQYSSALEQTFTIQNVSGFSNEIFFSDYDRQSPIHDRILKIYWKIKHPKKIFVSQACFGPTPSDIYKYLFSEMLFEVIKRGGSYTELMKYSQTDIIESQDLMERTLDLMELYSQTQTTMRKVPQNHFIDAEIQEEEEVEEKKSNVVIVFYGNKFTDYLEAATDASKKLKIPRYNLDCMIVDMLIQSSSPVIEEVNKIIETAYFNRMQVDDCVCRVSAIEDKTEELWRRIEIIKTSKPVVKGKTPKKPKKKKQKKSDKSTSASSRSSKKSASGNASDTFLGISEDTIAQILSQKIDQNEKMILESLHSIFLPNENLALKCFLKATKNVNCVYFVFFTCSAEEHNNIIRDEVQEMKDDQVQRREDIRKKLQDIHDYSSLAGEEYEVFQEILEQRRKQTVTKRHELRARIQTALNHYNNHSKANDLKAFWEYLDKYHRFGGTANVKLASRMLKLTYSQQQGIILHSKGTKSSKGSWESDSSKRKGKSPKKGKSKRGGSPKNADTVYLSQFDIKFCELLHILEHWDKRTNELVKPMPNFASIIASGRKSARSSTRSSPRKKARRRRKSLLSSPMNNIDVLDDNEAMTSTSYNPNIGYPVWIIGNAHKTHDFQFAPITSHLNQMIAMHCSKTTQRICKEIDVMYTVLKMPSARKTAEKPEVFEIIKSETTGGEEKRDITYTVSENRKELVTFTVIRNSMKQLQSIPSDVTTFSISAFLKSIIQESQYASPSSSISMSLRKKHRKRRLTLVQTASELEQIRAVPVRFILDPGQTQEVTILFKPLYSGTFKSTYLFEVVGTNYKQKVEVLAYCDYPRIDTSPNTMFPHRVQNVDSKSMFLNGIYVISQQVLDFGTLLYIPHNLLEAKSMISMLNTSTMTCYVAIIFRYESDAFFCEEQRVCIIIRPGRQYCLSVYAKPAYEGLFKETVFLIIRNNPMIQEINLSVYACPLKFEISPKHINFNKVILGKTETETVHFYNHTAVMVYFELDFDVSSEFRINSLHGYLEPCSIFELKISYTPETIGDRKESMTVKIFDREKQYPAPVHTEVLSVVAEVATFCLQYPTNVDLGLVRGKTPMFFPFTVTNSGKYDVKIILTKTHDPKKISDFFKMKHMEYVVKGESKYSNNCRFLCNKQLSFTDVPIMDVMILDNYRNSAVDYFTLKASGSVALSKFELCPYGEYFLGYQNVNTKRSSILTLKNTGKFSFSYTILTPKIIQEQNLRKKTKKEGSARKVVEVSSIPSIVETDAATSKSPSKSSKSRTTSSSRKPKKKKKSKPKMDNLELVTGVFTILPSRGTIQPNQTISITVNSAPTECNKYIEAVVFFVSEPSPEDHKGRVLNLHVEGTEPSISFTDFDFMFPELYITKCIEDLPYVGENFVFETNKQRLNFGKIAVYHSVKTKFRIPNTGHVTATVHYDVKEKDSDFTVSSRIIDIPPYKSEFNTICFAPKSIGIRSGILDIRCQGFSSGHILNQRMLLLGEACMPTIEILQPVFAKFGDIPKINFGSVFVDETAQENIIIKNNGSVPCNVIVEICDDPDSLLRITAQSESELAENDVRSAPVRFSSISLNTDEKAYINLMLQATKMGELEAELNISVVNNCFDSWKLPISAHCFYSAVSLIGLKTAYDDNIGIYYVLDFGYINKNKLYKLYFKIKNSSNKTYRFEFSRMFGLTFYPTVGHLYGSSEKHIVTGFTTNQNISLNSMQVRLTVTEIEVLSQESMLPWDDRQDCNIFYAYPSTPTLNSQSEETDQSLNALYDSLSLDMAYGKMEPEYKFMEDSYQIPILLNAKCSFSNYYCELREIIFNNVELHSEAVKLIYVENRSTANLKVRWTLMDAPQSDATPVDNINNDSSVIAMSAVASNSPSIDSTLRNLLREAFNIYPKAVLIPPDAEQEFKITFSPTRNEVHEFILKANMENLNPETSDLEISLRGDILQFPYQIHSPYLEEYEQNDSRFKAFCGFVAENNTKLLNFLALGIGSKCVRSLYILNDTDTPIGYTWKNVKTNSEKASFFHCEKKEGDILPGKMGQSNFGFIPQFHGIFTDSFCFTPNDPILPRTSILLLGHCREPLVYYEHPYVALETTLINSPADKEIIMRNDEEEGIHFRFKKSTLVSIDQQVLTVSPMSGIMKPNSKNSIRFFSQSTKCGETIFNVKCLIQHMSTPLQLNVITNVIQVTSALIYFSKELQSMDMEPNIVNVIKLGVIIPHKKEKLTFELQNTCSVGLYYSWTSEDKLLKTRIQFLQEKGYLNSLRNRKFTIFLTAVRPSVIKSTYLRLNILHGPSYVFRIEASANKPMYSFSFLKYDFGKCIIQKETMKFYNTELVFSNRNCMTVVLENGQSGGSEFTINFKSAEVKPDESVTISIFFHPRETKLYSEWVTFFVNSHKVVVKLFGQGVPLALDVLIPSEKFLNFGSVKLGKIVQKSVRMLNSSEATVFPIFDFNCRLPLNKKVAKEEYIIEKSILDEMPVESKVRSKAMSAKKRNKNREKSSSTIKEDKSVKTSSNTKFSKGDGKKKAKDSSSGVKSIGKNTVNSEMLNAQLEEELNHFLKESFEILPKKPVKIIPGGTIELIVKFKPKKCREPFQANVFFDVLDYREPILHIIGSAVDANFRLNKDVVAFGNVVVGYPNEETIVLINDGHIGGKFKWFLEKKTSYVNFIGGEGFSPPNSKVTTTIVFKPGHVQCFFRFKAYCKIENYDKQLNLLLTGGSMNVPPPLDIIHFETAVREETSQSIIFKNETKESWNSKPVFTGAFFSGNEMLHVPKESSCSYEITYAPMKFSHSPHEGTVFFPLPCGFSRLYSLRGMVSCAKPAEVISRDITSKTYHTEILKVKNWLGLRQTFKVKTKVMEIESGRIIYKITSNDLVEVPPHGVRDFKWTIYVLNEGKLSLKVSFVNEKTKDYVYYQINLRITTSETNIETITFSTCVRIPVTKNITITNPLHETLEYTSSTVNPNVYVDSTFKIPPYEKYQLAVKYLPVKVEKTLVRLHLDNPQIGGYDYNLVLQSYPPNLESEVRLKGHLGQTVAETIFLPQDLHFRDVSAKDPHYRDVSAEITENPCFEVHKINTQTENPYVDVVFIPTDLGYSRGSLHIFSYLGEHTYPLLGECTEPKPQGPFILRYGETINIDFTNPFEETKLFEFSVDNDFFQVQPLSETIKERKSVKLSVTTTKEQRSDKQESKSSLNTIERMGTVTGKMFVKCEYENSPLKWIYYLQCEISIK